MNTKDQSKNIEGTKYIDSRCIIHFRPVDGWEGEYGFDWLRIGDTQEKINNQIIMSNYEGVGVYEDIGNQYVKDNREIVPIRDNKIEYLHTEYSQKKIKNLEGEKPYLVSWISTFNYNNQQYNCKSRVKILIHAENVKKIRIYKSLGLNEKVIKVISDANGDFSDYIDIECLEGNAIKLLARAEFNSGEKAFAGQAVIVGYTPKKINICFIPIVTAFQIGTNTSSGINESELLKKLSEQKIILPKLLAQAQIVPIIDEKKANSFGKETLNKINKIIDDFKPKIQYFDQEGNQCIGYELDNRGYYLEADNDSGILVEKLYDAVKPFLPDHFIFFLINQRGKSRDSGEIRGQAIDIPSLNPNNNSKCKSAVIFSTQNSATVCHELLHCLGLFHTFSSHSRHIFKKGSTNNIMDYSSNRQTLWKWQWDIIRKAHGVRNYWPNN